MRLHERGCSAVLSIRNIWLDMKGVLRVSRQMINAELESLNLSGAEGDILFHLLTGSNGFQQEELAGQLDIGKAAISRVVDSLEKKGYVTRMRRQKDKRAYSVTLTEKGFSIGEAIKGAYNRLFTLAKNGITDEELLHVASLLSRVAQNVQSAGEE